MLFINAVSIAPAARDWLLNSSHPQVLHVFDHVCNLINERAEVFSIVTPQVGNGPFNLVIEGNDLLTNRIEARSPIFIHTDRIKLRDVTIDLSNAELWISHPDWQTLHANRDEILSQLRLLSMTAYHKRSLDTFFARNAQGYSTTAPGPNLPITVHEFPNSLISNLPSAISTIDISSALMLTSQLAGLGNGLTPAGDDFIIGSMLAAWIIHPNEIAENLAKQITETAAPLTTSLSAAWLRSAGRGEAGILWHCFFEALISKEQGAIQKSFDKLLAVGHTSGADALAGFIDTFMCLAEAEQTKIL